LLKRNHKEVTMFRSLFITRWTLVALVALVLAVGGLGGIAAPILAQSGGTTSVTMHGKITVEVTVWDSGRVVTTTRDKHGNSVTTVRNQDGSSQTILTSSDGSTTIVTDDGNGHVTTSP
jgi:hypothetical protein